MTPLLHRTRWPIEQSLQIRILLGMRGLVLPGDPLHPSLSQIVGAEIRSGRKAGGSRRKEETLSRSLGQSVPWKVIFNLFHMNREKHETFRGFIIILYEINTVFCNKKMENMYLVQKLRLKKS